MLNIFLLRFNNFHKLNLHWESVKAVVLVQEFEKSPNTVSNEALVNRSL